MIKYLFAPAILSIENHCQAFPSKLKYSLEEGSNAIVFYRQNYRYK